MAKFFRLHECLFTPFVSRDKDDPSSTLSSPLLGEANHSSFTVYLDSVNGFFFCFFFRGVRMSIYGGTINSPIVLIDTGRNGKAPIHCKSFISFVHTERLGLEDSKEWRGNEINTMIGGERVGKREKK